MNQILSSQTALVPSQMDLQLVLVINHRGRGHGIKTTINSAYYFSNEYLKAVKDVPIEGCVNNIQIRNNKSSERIQIRYSKRLRDQN